MRWMEFSVIFHGPAPNEEKANKLFRPPARTLYPTLLGIRVFVGARYTFVRILFLMYPWIYLDVSCVYPKGYMYPDCILMYLKNLS